MSELTLVAEDILKAIHAMEEAYHASQEMRENTNHATFDEFRQRMLALHDRLEKLKMVLDNEEAYAVDELADALSMAYTGHRLEYRRTPRRERSIGFNDSAIQRVGEAAVVDASRTD